MAAKHGEQDSRLLAPLRFKLDAINKSVRPTWEAIKGTWSEGTLALLASSPFGIGVFWWTVEDACGIVKIPGAL